MLQYLLEQVRDFLGKEGYHWFSACAVYPELRWQLTLYLGYELISDNGEELEAHLAKLARLPWFRYGYMSNWLRGQLVTDLLAQQKDKEIRDAIKTFLQPVQEDSSK